MRSIWLCYLIALISVSAHAIVNVEELRHAPAENGFSGRFDLSISGDSGNTEKSSASIGTRLQWKQDKITNLFIMNYAYGESDNVTDTNKGFVHLRHIFQANEKHAYETFAQVETNEFARLTFRGLLGGGIRYTAHRDDNNSIYIGAGAFHAWETLDQQPGLTDDGTESFWRANLYLALNYRINTHVRAVSTTYYQPALEDVEDVRLLEEAGLKVNLADDLDLKISLEIVHDSQPPDTVKNTDISYSTGIEYHF